MKANLPPSASAAPRAAAASRPAGRRLPLADIVRDLAGWTLPAGPPAPGRPPASWQLA